MEQSLLSNLKFAVPFLLPFGGISQGAVKRRTIQNIDIPQLSLDQYRSCGITWVDDTATPRSPICFSGSKSVQSAFGSAEN